MSNATGYRRLAFGTGIKSAIVQPSTRQISTNREISARATASPSKRLMLICEEPTASASAVCESFAVFRSSRSRVSGFGSAISEYTRHEYRNQPEPLTFRVNVDTIAPIRARAGQVIVCNPFGLSHTLTVIVRTDSGRIVGTVTRAVAEPLAQLLELEAQGVLTREVSS